MHSTNPAKAQRKTQAVTINLSGDKPFRVLDVTLKRHQYQQDALMEILHMWCLMVLCADIKHQSQRALASNNG